MADILGKEIVSTFDFNQFQPGESLDQCGPAAVALAHFAGEVESGPQGNPEDAIALMKDLYEKFLGPDVKSDENGTELDVLYEMIAAIGNHYQNLYPDGGVSGTDTRYSCPQWSLKDAIRKWVEIGYPVIIAVTEDSVFDLGLKRKPYDWDTENLSHIITVTGVASSGVDFLVRDTANVLAPGPRLYGVTPLKIISATVIVPGIKMWLPRPKSVKASDMKLPVAPVQEKPVNNPEPEQPAEPTVEELKAQLIELHKQIAEIQAMLAKVADETKSASPTVI